MTGNERNPFLPLLIILITLTLWFGFQTYQLQQERKSLSVLAANQEPLYKNSQKLRNQLDALASGTSRLAQQGNANAQQIVSALAQRGITIHPNEAATPAPK
jgi:hypothetical protein